MDELVRTFRQFIIRDAIYVVGGSLVLITGLYGFDTMPEDLTTIPIAAYLVAAGLAYAIGYALQEIACLTSFFRTAAYGYKPKGLMRWLYVRFTRRPYSEPWKDGVQPQEPSLMELEELPERATGFLERLVGMKQVSTTIGPCALVGALLLLKKTLEYGATTDWFFTIALAVLAVMLTPLGWFKLAQEAEWRHELAFELRRRKEKGTSGSV